MVPVSQQSFLEGPGGTAGITVRGKGTVGTMEPSPWPSSDGGGNGGSRVHGSPRIRTSWSVGSQGWSQVSSSSSNRWDFPPSSLEPTPRPNPVPRLLGEEPGRRWVTSRDRVSLMEAEASE